MVHMMRQEEDPARIRASGSQVVQRVALLMRLVAAGQRSGLRLADLHRAASLERPTVHRLLQALVGERLLRQDGASRRYFLGPAMYEMGLAASPQLALRDICQGEELTLHYGIVRACSCSFLVCVCVCVCVYSRLVRLTFECLCHTVTFATHEIVEIISQRVILERRHAVARRALQCRRNISRTLWRCLDHLECPSNARFRSNRGCVVA